MFEFEGKVSMEWSVINFRLYRSKFESRLYLDPFYIENWLMTFIFWWSSTTYKNVSMVMSIEILNKESNIIRKIGYYIGKCLSFQTNIKQCINENNITSFQQAFLYILVSMSNLLIVFTYKYHKTAIKGQLNL